MAVPGLTYLPPSVHGEPAERRARNVPLAGVNPAQARSRIECTDTAESSGAGESQDPNIENLHREIVGMTSQEAAVRVLARPATAGRTER